MHEEPIELERMDAICSGFEESWQPDLSLKSLQEMVGDHAPAGTPEFAQLLVEVAQIDLEKRWRFLARHASDARPDETPVEFAARHEMPGWQDYLVLFPDGRAGETVRKLLKDCELRSRLKYGDAPVPSSLVPENCPDARYERFMPEVSILASGRSRFTAPFCGVLLVGRQDVEEPAPPAMVSQSRGFKLICAPLEDKSISRLQFTVTVYAGNSLRIANSSSNTFVQVANSHFLKPGETHFARVPVDVKLDSMVIQLRRRLLEDTWQSA